MKSNPTIQNCLAIQYLSSGDRRFLRYQSNGQYPIQISEYLFESPQDTGVSDDVIVIHIPDTQYLYGSSYMPDGVFDRGHLYAEMDHRGYHEYTVIDTRQLPNSHMGWTLAPSSTVLEHSRASGSVVVSGLSGVARVLGLPSTPFLWISVERYESTVALVSGSHIIQHHTIPIGTSHMVQTLTETLNVESTFARGVLERHGLLYSHHDDAVRSVLVRCIAPLIDLIGQTITYAQGAPYRSVFERAPMQIWVGAGIGMVSVPGLAEYLAMHIPVPRYREIHEHYRSLIQASSVPITRDTLPKYYLLLGLTALVRSI